MNIQLDFMKILSLLLILSIIFISCDKKEDTVPSPAKATTTVTHDTSTGATPPPIQTNTYIGYYSDTVADYYINMGTGLNDYEPGCVLYVMHTAYNQLVIQKNSYLFFGGYQYILSDTFTINSQNYYLSTGRRVFSIRRGPLGEQTGCDQFSVAGDTLYFTWSYAVYVGCLYEADHICNYMGIKQK